MFSPRATRALRAVVAAFAAMATASLAVSAQTSVTAGDITLRIIVTGTLDDASRVRERLEAGEDFATVAWAVSLDPSADRGGLLVCCSGGSARCWAGTSCW